MYYAPIEKPKVTEAPVGEPRHSLLLGVAFLVAAVPYWGCRLLVHLLARDIRRLTRFVRICGATYSEGFKRG